MEEDHRSEVKVYLQKVKHLEFERDQNNTHVETDGDQKRQNEITRHIDRNSELQNKKKLHKKDYETADKVDEQRVETINDENQRALNIARENFQGKIGQLTDKYESQ